MTNAELYEYIADQTQQGVADDVLRQSLMESGWTELEIENTFHDVAAGLSPLTEGVSLHEDVSQVRSMVTLLAARIRNIEAALATSGALPMQVELPAGFGVPEHTLTAGRSTSRFTIMALGYAVISVWMALSAYLRGWAGPLASVGIMTSIGLIAILMGFVLYRTGRAWAAAIFTATAVTAWGAETFVAWYSYGAMEWSTALALGVLLLVLAAVMGRRISRLT